MWVIIIILLSCTSERGDGGGESIFLQSTCGGIQYCLGWIYVGVVFFLHGGRTAIDTVGNED